MKKIAIILMFVFMISIVAAENFKKQSAEVDLKHPVRIGEYPNNAIGCNISVFDPDNLVLVNYSEMTNQFSFHNYTLSASNTSKLGVYLYDITCSTGASNKTESFDFEVTVTGKAKLSTGEGIALFISLIAMILVGLFLLLAGLKSVNAIPKIIFTTLALIILLVTVLYSLMILTQNFGGFSTFTEGYVTFYTVVKVIIGVSLMFFTIWIGLAALKSWKIHRGLRDR